MITNKELDEMIDKCETAQDLKELQNLCANEIIGKITDKQALKILKVQQEYEARKQEGRENERKTI